MTAGCAKCGLTFVKPDVTADGPYVIYCAGCVKEITDERKGRQKGRTVRTGPTTVAHADPAAVPGTFYPRTSKDEAGKERCGLCGSDELQFAYGACCYGLGGFAHCFGCGGILDFTDDTGE